MNKKTRRDAKLKSLPIQRQAEVMRVLEESGITQAALDRLEAELGIGVRSLATISEFWAWYRDPRQRIARELESAGSVTEFVVDRMRQRAGNASEEEVFAFGQRFFSELAISMQDPLAWSRTQRIGIRGKELALDFQRFRRETCELFLRWYEDQRALQVAQSSSSNADKIEALGRIMFGESWETKPEQAAPVAGP